MSREDLGQMAAFASALCDEVRPLLQGHFRSGLAVDTKADRTPVTEADRQVERLLRARIREAWPEHGLRGEEHGAENDDAEWVWAIDPIDGTRSFVAGRPLFTTLIALLHRGRPLIGAIEAPMLEERWLGLEGSPTTLNGQTATVRAPRPLAESIVCVARPGHYRGPLAAGLERLREACAWLFFENDAYGYGQLARGDMDVVVEVGLQAEDICALVPVVRGAGGVIHHWDGSDPGLDDDDTLVAATSASLADEAVALMRDE